MFQANYQVKVTKAARRQGDSLPISPKEKLEIIRHLKALKFWSDNRDDFDYEMALEAFEFKFDTKDHWIRIFVYQDDVRKIMHVIKVMVKKTNRLKTADLISLKTAISSIKQEIEHFKEVQKNQAKDGVNHLRALEGGKGK